jgi:uncharacterized membrane protein
MMASPTPAAALLAAFLGSAVECVEALTIVLAVGLVRGWRSAFAGTAAGLAVLASLVAALGPALGRLPIAALQLAAGVLLLLFGLRWLRKAILRAAGVLALHDEEAAFAREADALRQADGRDARSRIDAAGFLAAFKGVLLEGAEVVFIVLTAGAGGGQLGPAAAGAGLALAAVAAAGLLLHRPLARVPENTLKFAVGTLLTAFGAFWVGEGLALEWPAGELALPALVGIFAASAGLFVGVARRAHRAPRGSRGSRAPAASAAPRRGRLAAVAAELGGLVVDDGRLAAGALAVVLAAALLAGASPLLSPIAATALALGLVGVLGWRVRRRAAA